MDLRIQQARRQLGRRRLAKAEEAVVDVGAGAQWWSYPTVDAVPCLFSSYDGGHYLLKRDRFVTDTEVARVQGIPDMYRERFAMALGLRKLRAAIGNAMSSIMLARVLAYALPAAGLSCRDEAAAPTAADMERILPRPRSRLLVQPAHNPRRRRAAGKSFDSFVVAMSCFLLVMWVGAGSCRAPRDPLGCASRARCRPGGVTVSMAAAPCRLG